ncbi:MAG: hypothetical protein M1835_003472 [Candelina submexicana]|nr:MAG: hypothetical protein M1835_003472 [Candelina submexicana]
MDLPQFTSAQLDLADSIRDLVRQRDEMAKSDAVDADELGKRLERVERSRSCTPILPPFDPDDPEEIEETLRVEREAHEALISDNGRPCYPIELGLDIFKDPGQYKEVFEYWKGELGVGEDTERWIFFLQLKRWKKFRQFQQANRRYFVFHNRFSEFQQKVLERRWRHGLDGDVQLLEEQSKQSKLDDWMEYQDYELREYERLEKKFKEAQAQLASRRIALAEVGVSAFEGVQELEFASYYSLAVKCSGEEGRAEKAEQSAERKLRLAGKRLKAAESDDLGESVERVTWVNLFLKEFESTQIRLDGLQRLAGDARRESEPFERWLQARHIEWGEKRLEGPEEAERMITLEAGSAEYQDKMKKRKELKKSAYDASFNCYLAKEEVEFAEEVYNAARLDDLGETIERAALIKMAQGEVRSAQTQVEEAREPLRKIRLKRQVINALSWIPLERRKIKRHNILLEWIEQQRREIAGGPVNIEQEGGQGRSKGPSSRALRNHPTAEALRLNKTLKADGRKRKRSMIRSILSPVDPGKVSKAPSKRRSPRQKMSFPCGAPKEAEKTTTDSAASESRRNQTLKVKNAMPAPLRPIHVSRVSKSGQKRPNELRKGGTKLPPTTGTHRRKREHNLGSSSTPSTSRKAMQRSVNASLRRSTRPSKPPERFRPIVT